MILQIETIKDNSCRSANIDARLYYQLARVLVACRGMSFNSSVIVFRMTRTNDMDAVKAFAYGTTVQLQEIADAVNELGGGKEGKPIDRKTVWRYSNTTKPPLWFIERLDQAFPGWREQKSGKIGRRISTESETPVSGFRRRLMPVVSSLDSPTMNDDLKSAQDPAKWKGPEFETIDLFGLRFPLQPVEVTEYEPAFSPFDAVLLDTDADAVMGRLYLVQKDGQTFYAKLARIDGYACWQKYDGSTLPYKLEDQIAALVVHLPQYRLKLDAGTFNRLGLDTDSQVKWPKGD